MGTSRPLGYSCYFGLSALSGYSGHDSARLRAVQGHPRSSEVSRAIRVTSVYRLCRAIVSVGLEVSRAIRVTSGDRLSRSLGAVCIKYSSGGQVSRAISVTIECGL